MCKTDERGSGRITRMADLQSGLFLPALGICLLFELSCVGPLPIPPSFLDPLASPHPACDPARSLVASASSTQGREDAELLARRAIVRKVDSEIQVETERLAEVSKNEGRFTSERRLREVIREHSSFRNAEQIRTVGFATDRDGRTWALACLDREEAARAVFREIEAGSARFESAMAQAFSAIDEGDRPGFVRAFREASREELSLLRLFVQRRVLSGAGGEEEERLRRRARALREAAAGVRSSTLVWLRHESTDLPDGMRDEVTESIRTYLARMGVQARIAGVSGCPGDDGGLLFEIRSSRSCGWGALGHSCRPQVAVVGSECGTDRILFRSAPAGLGQGSDAREPERALRRAMMDPRSAIQGTLEEAFSAVVPWEGGQP